MSGLRPVQDQTEDSLAASLVEKGDETPAEPQAIDVAVRNRIPGLTVGLGSLVLAFAFAINWWLARTEDTALLIPRNDPDYYLENARVKQYDDMGQLHHQLDAQRFTHYPVTDITTLQAPTLSLAPTSDTSPWQIVADHGRILRSTGYRDEIVEFWGQVVVTRAEEDGKFTTILTDSLSVHPGSRHAETDTPVTVKNQRGETQAAGIEAFFEQDRFVFHSSLEQSVTTIFLPPTLD